MSTRAVRPKVIDITCAPKPDLRLEDIIGTFRFQSTSSATKSTGSDVFTFTVRPLLSFALFRIQFRFHSTYCYGVAMT